MEKRTADKAKKWNNEMTVERSRRVEREQYNQKAASGEYIPIRHVEPLFSKTEIKVGNNEKLLIYFFIGVIVCIAFWKSFDLIKDRYWMDELDQASQKLLTALERDNREAGNELNKLRAGFRPTGASNYQIKTRDRYKGSVCKEHVKTEIYERTTLRCDRNTPHCTVISTNEYRKKGTC